MPKSLKLQPFQDRFLEAVDDPAITTVALSMPRGNGKSTLAALVLKRWLDRRTGGQSYIVAASLGQCKRTTFGLLTGMLDTSRYSIALGLNDVHVICRSSGSRVDCLAANHKTGQGIVDTDFVVADEPGAWEMSGGEAMHSAIRTAQGKPGSNLKCVYIGTLAPMATSAGHWWRELAESGNADDRHVQMFAGDIETWNRQETVEAANPLMWKFATSRKVLMREMTEALSNERKKAEFCSYRLNLPTRNQSDVLITVDVWKQVLARPAGARKGRPIVGVDMGSSRAWTSAVAIWPDSWAVDAVAISPGIPGIADIEKRDGVATGDYRELVKAGCLHVAEGLRVPPASMLVDLIGKRWGKPAVVVCDRFREADLRDAAPKSWKLEPRVSRWSEAAADVRSLRVAAGDGVMNVTPDAASLLTASLAAAKVKNDDAGNTRLEKNDTHCQSRDDVAAALLLAAGEADRRGRKKPRRRGYRGGLC